MPEPDAPHDAANAENLGLDSFRRPPEEEGLSLDKLKGAFAAMLGAGDDPYSTPPEPSDDDPLQAAIDAEQSMPHLPGGRPTGDGQCEINPRSILEAMLFVGAPDNQPLAAAQIAGLMRGVRPAEIDELVIDLNAAYSAESRPYRIVGSGIGYRLSLAEEFGAVREKFQGRIKQAQLSPAAVEVLAVVAYNEPLTADDVNRLRGTPSGPILGQLVRRQLLRIERAAATPLKPHYFTTERFLQFFGIRNLDELPRSLDLERQ